MGEYSQIVADGMKRACSDFTKIVQPLGFKKAKRRSWVRVNGETEETIHISRRGASYGTNSPSISLQLDLVSRNTSDGSRHDLSHHDINMMKRATGYGYHHRFNAESGSTYDRCIEELRLFMKNVGEPWFGEQR